MCRALVDQYAAALARPARPPGTGVVIRLGAVPVGDDPHQPLASPKTAGLQEFFCARKQRVGALIIHDTEHGAGCFRGLEHRPRPPGGYPERLFGKHMQPAGKRRFGHRRVGVMRRSDQHRVQLCFGEHVLIIRIARHAREVLCRPAAFRLVDITHRRQRQSLDSAGIHAHRMALPILPIPTMPMRTFSIADHPFALRRCSGYGIPCFAAGRHCGYGAKDCKSGECDGSDLQRQPVEGCVHSVCVREFPVFQHAAGAACAPGGTDKSVRPAQTPRVGAST